MKPSDLVQRLKEARATVDNQQYDQALPLFTEILDAIPATTDDLQLKETRLAALLERGKLLEQCNLPKSALNDYTQWYQETETSAQTIEVLTWMADQHSHLGHYQKALGIYEEALRLLDSQNYSGSRGRVLKGKGVMLFYLGRLKEALDNFQKALALFRRAGNETENRRTQNWIGMVYFQQGKPDKAIAAFQTSLALSRQASNEYETLIVLNNLGESYQILYDMEKALTYHQEALALAEGVLGTWRKADDPQQAMPLQERERFLFARTDLCRNMGVNLRHLGQVEEGIDYLKRALRYSREINQLDVRLQTLYALGQAELQRGERETAAKYAQQLKESAEKSEARNHLARALYLLGRCRQQDDQKTAEQLWQQAIFLAHETGQRILLWHIHMALAQTVTDPNLAQVHKRIAAEIIYKIAAPIEDDAVRQKFLNASPIQAILKQ